MVSEDRNRSKNRRQFLKTAGVATAATFAIPITVTAKESSNTPFDPSDKDEVLEYIEWVDDQEDTIEQINSLSDEQVDAIGDVMTDISWSYEEVEPKSTTESTIQGYEDAHHVGKAVGSIENETTEYILEHRIDWYYDNGDDYKSVESTITPDPHGALAEYVNASKKVDKRERKDEYFINRASADFKLVGIGRQVTAEVDCKGNIYGEGETVSKNAPL
ncbi:twin-arginine translocation signal domain-containing protein [Halogeometricum borinquense]|uniref:Twin-arginine translocation signal domain-containing protein n=1 Tax=Halogeometricum borinquense TaxID=60847 RepID=A0A6C0UJD1_9EURY|nr:twin-arginine translocation signal domain-containing protein [Halogeometricum borinquense]QIB75545.1 twin-arginine translocation signal domain-containing protein [Halogeometricum borinquense]